MRSAPLSGRTRARLLRAMLKAAEAGDAMAGAARVELSLAVRADAGAAATLERLKALTGTAEKV